MEIQEIKIDGVVYVPAEAEPNKTICTGCAFAEIDCCINQTCLVPCDLWGRRKPLKVKDSIMSRHVSLPLWQLKNIYEALRITSNIHNCSQLETCHDRLVTKAIGFIEPLIKKD